MLNGAGMQLNTQCSCSMTPILEGNTCIHTETNSVATHA